MSFCVGDRKGSLSCAEENDPAPVHSSRNVHAELKDENKEAKPRSLRFTWSMKTTSSMDPSDMMREIRKVLDANNCDYEQRERFLLFCVQGDGHREHGAVGDGGV